MANGERPVISLTAKRDRIDTQEPPAQELELDPSDPKRHGLFSDMMLADRFAMSVRVSRVCGIGGGETPDGADNGLCGLSWPIGNRRKARSVRPQQFP